MEDLDRQRHQWIADQVLPYEDEVRRYFKRYSSAVPADDIDDLIQEAYARLCKAEFSHIIDGRAFLYATVRNALQDQLRRTRVVKIEYVGELDLLLLDEAPGPEQRVSALQEYERLLEAVETLTERRREVYELRKFRELPQREIGRILGIAEKTVENLLRFAQREVMKVMCASGYAASGQTDERG